MTVQSQGCMLCPRYCDVDRETKTGYCGADNTVKIARAALHHWEEPCISGRRGSGTVFFSYCNLKCVFCQNYRISTWHQGKHISTACLAEKFLDLQAQGAHNINLVTPTHYVPQIIEALALAKTDGLSIPIVYNSSAYETVETIQMLNGYIDIYLPDLKYYDDTYAIKYSRAEHYFQYASAAIAQMFAQAGSPVFDSDGMMRSGVIVRHLMLPHLLFDSKKILDYLYQTYHDDIYISIMSQYTPLSALINDYPELNMKIQPAYYSALIDYAVKLGITNAFIQEGEAADESFIPSFSPDEL